MKRPIYLNHSIGDGVRHCTAKGYSGEKFLGKFRDYEKIMGDGFFVITVYRNIEIVWKKIIILLLLLYFFMEKFGRRRLSLKLVL